MGCQASYLTPSAPQILTNSPNLEAPSKRLASLSYLEKSPTTLEFTLQLIPHNKEIERVSMVSVEIQRYSLQNRPPCQYTFIDMFYNTQEELGNEDKLLFKIQENSTGTRMILKMVPFEDYEDYALKAGIHEISLLQSHVQRNLLRLRDFYINDFGKNRKKFLILLYDEAEFTLADLIQYRKLKMNPWKEEELLRFYREFAEIGIALEQTHICHRDIRPENFWYNLRERQWKLANFSSARMYQMEGNDAFSHDLLLNSFRGRPEYQSSEIRRLLKEGHDMTTGVYNAFLNDVYEFGMVFLMMNKTETVIEQEWVAKAEILEAWDDRLSVEIICKMMNGNMLRRLDFENLKILIDQSSDKEKLFSTRNTEYNLYNEMIQDLQKEQTLALKILKQEKFAHAYFKLLQTEQALNEFDELLSFFESHNDEENTANSLKEIGEFSRLLGNHNKGKELFRQSLDIYNRIGSEARKNGDLRKSVEVYEKALALAGMLYSTKDPLFVQVLENLGNAYRLAGKYEEAKQCQEKVLGILLKLKGEKSIEVARVLNNLGNTYVGLKEYDTSIELLRSSVKTIRDCVTDNPNLLAMALCNLGEVYRHKKLYNEAKNCVEESLIIKEKLFGTGPSLEMASVLDNLGNIYYDLQEFPKAKKLYEKALVMKEGEMDNFNIEIAISLNNIGNASRCLKEFKVAEGFYKRGIQIYSAHVKERHAGYAAIMGNLGLLYRDTSKKKEARKYLNEAVKILKEIAGTEDQDYLFYKKELESLK